MRNLIRVLASAACLLLGFEGIVQAQLPGSADLNISPKRLVFDAATRSATVFVFNRGTAPGTYSIDLADRYMLPDGQILNASDAGSDPERAAVAARVASALPLVTFSPRRVTLAPGQTQTIRVRVLRPAELAAGEYRSHLTVTTLPSEDTGLTAEQAAKPAEGQLAVRVTALFSLSIPVIVRQGDAAAAAGIRALHLDLTDPSEPGGAAGTRQAVLNAELTRSGTGSVYGNLLVRSDKDPKSTEPLGAIGGIAVYPEIDHRAVQLKLRRIPVAGEHLTVTFVDDDRSPGAVLASEALTVP
jgi:P pilus assembly chaperone PapD